MTKLGEIECYLLDMDGTIYLSDQLIDKAKEFVDTLEKKAKDYVFFTNNSAKNSKDYQQKLERLGLSIPLERIVNSGEVTADYIRSQKEGAKVYPLGTPSFEKELEEAGLELVKEKQAGIDFVALAFDTTLTYQKLWDAHDLILSGVEYVAANPDYVCPLKDGKTMPDCGSMISLLETSTGKKPLVIGKPNSLMIDYVAKNLGISKANLAMVGDRLYTDIQMAIDADITSILVLSGETDREMLAEAPQDPDFVFESVAEIKKKLEEL
ncbi:HAD-IIA family hydrolase [Halanaerobium sp. Z-7514]|uniref:Acid sugar phosphatase n=1 Tax=Halanaerobium polyolivorans TaxID=2886943 RepID=A0AAW4WZB2_9FIRM|nr:HAD-IIA family hydrolase [Halanaerobium polyolivorans]MCC3144577.1 HAD-IIA family hydrolase [Halanaerobium polyolivorans]